MAGRTFATGDIHGDLDALLRNEAQLPKLDAADTLVFVGDYVDRGPSSAQVIEHLRSLPHQTPAKVVTLMGNHEDAWLRIMTYGWPEFVLPPENGCRETMESYLGPVEGALPEPMQQVMLAGSFYPLDVVEWLKALPLYYEDEHGIYVHAGLILQGDKFPHPAAVELPTALLWHRDQSFFRDYRGKRVVFGHTGTQLLPEELSSDTPEDPTDMWAGPCTIGLDTGCGKGGFLTTIELPSMQVFESR